MPTPSESCVTVSGTPSKMVALLRKRLRQLLRLVVVLAACVAVAATAFAIWWLNSLNGLPDIGDPFDIAEFRSSRIPDDQNAFALLRRANEKFTPVRWGEGPHWDDPRFSWSIANPASRDGVGENREALELFLQAADQSDAAHPDGEPTANVEIWKVFGVACLEGCRRQESGDTAGAWDCYRAALRMITHVRRRGSTDQRYSAKRCIVGLRRRLTDWATDPRTTPAQLHTALDEVLKNEPNPAWDISAIKSDYLELMREIEGPMPRGLQLEIEDEWAFGLGDMALSPTMIGYLEAARRFLWREPERSRRVLRLLCAQYLAHQEAHEMPPREPAVWVKISCVTSTNPVTKVSITGPLYPVSPQAPAGARALSPQELARWLVKTLDARPRFLREWRPVWPPDRAGDPRAIQDRKAHRGLIIMLATELYHRERGTLPSSDEALVGTYLKSLPDDGLPDVYDPTEPTVE